MTSFRILGPIEASVDGRLLALGGPRQLKLFAFLVLHANRAVSRDAADRCGVGSRSIESRQSSVDGDHATAPGAGPGD